MTARAAAPTRPDPMMADYFPRPSTENNPPSCEAGGTRTRESRYAPSSARRVAAAAAIAAILPLAVARGMYFIPQSGASTSLDAGT